MCIRQRFRSKSSFQLTRSLRVFDNIILVAAIALVNTAVLQAAVIIPTNVTATSELDVARGITNVINGSGMTMAGDVSTWTHAALADNEYWLGAIADGQVLTFELESASTVGTVYVWQYGNSWGTRAIKTFDISCSSNGVDYAITNTGLSLVEANPAPIAVQTVNFTQQTNITHIKVTPQSNWGDGTWYGLLEMYFGEGTAGPLPPTLNSLNAANITETEADLLGTLNGADADVTVFWDTVDRGENFTWANTNSPSDAFDATTVGTVVSNHVSGLTAGQTNYFAFYATNAASNVWAFSSFQATPQDPVIQPATASNPSFLNDDAGYGAIHLVNGNGLVPGSGDVLTNLHQVADNNKDKYWLSKPGIPGTNTFTLAGSADVDGIYVWQYNRLGGVPRQIVSFSLAFSTDGSTYPTTISGLTLDTNAGGVLVLPQTVPFDPQYGVTHIRMLDMVNGVDAYYGLCEVRFKRAEPAGPPAGTVIFIK